MKINHIVFNKFGASDRPSDIYLFIDIQHYKKEEIRLGTSLSAFSFDLLNLCWVYFTTFTVHIFTEH